MRPLYRWLLKSVAAISLLLVLLAVTARVFAMSANDVWSHENNWFIKQPSACDTLKWEFIFSDGEVILIRSFISLPNSPYHRSDDEGLWHHETSPASTCSVRDFAASVPEWSPLQDSSVKVQGLGSRDIGFYSWQTQSPIPGYSYRGFLVGIPLWLPAAIFLTIGILTYLKARPRYPDGFCEICGYDLRATPERCPECGAIPPQNVTISA
jgi:hypothetical protein